MRIPIGVHDTPLPLLLGDDTGPLPLLGGMAVGDADAMVLNFERKRGRRTVFTGLRRIAEGNILKVHVKRLKYFVQD